MSLLGLLTLFAIVAVLAAKQSRLGSRADFRASDRSFRSTLPLGTRLARMFRTRSLGDFEFCSRFVEHPPALEITFFVEQRPTSLEFVFAPESGLRIESVRFEAGEPARDCAQRTETRGGLEHLRLEPLTVESTRRIELRLAGLPSQFQGQLAIRARRQAQGDLEIAREAQSLAALGRIDAAIGKLREYERFSTENPAVCYQLAEWKLATGALDGAREYIARGLARGDADILGNLYRTVQRSAPGPDLRRIRELQAEGRDWRLPSHHGAIVLERRQTVTLELNGGRLVRSREILEIRRPAAARMLRQLQFSFSEPRDTVLHSHVKVVHSGGEIEEVPEEHFTIRDREGGDLFVAVQGDKSGHWILPDLEPGDVVEFAFDLYHRDRELDDDEPKSFSLVSLFNEVIPTLRGHCRFVFRPDTPVRFAVRNLDVEPVVRQREGRVVHAFEGSRHVPAQGTGFRFENEFLNPLIACGVVARDWSAVAASALRSNFGSPDAEESLPKALRDALEDDTEPDRTLRKAFYWTRDRLKYAAVRSGYRRIGDPDRARQILDAGVADCKDRSYLLGLVCRELGIPFEFLAVSSKNGLVVEELPVDQFDHVFVRARPRDEWAWLDASNPMSPFGLPPASSQGLCALRLSDPASIIEIPTVPPETNSIELEESFGRLRDARIEGRFELAAHGQSARLIDEHWKAASLTFDERLHAGREALRHFLPACVVDEYSRHSDTSESDVFRVAGRHSRGPLVALGERNHLICTLAWDVPFLPFSYWRTLRTERLFFSEFAARLCLSIRLDHGVFRALEDTSRVEPLDNPVGAVSEEVLEEPRSRTIRRTIVLKKRFVREGDLALVAPTLERIESALQLVLTLDPGRS